MLFASSVEAHSSKIFRLWDVAQEDTIGASSWTVAYGRKEPRRNTGSSGLVPVHATGLAELVGVIVIWAIDH